MARKVAKNRKLRRADHFKFIKELLLAELEPRAHKRKEQSTNDELREREATKLAERREAEEAEYEMEQIVNMLRLFVHMEKLMAFSLLACFNCFLYYFTVFPARLVYCCFNEKRLKQARKEFVTLFLIACASAILLKVDTSQVYHRIKGQSAMKLYMMFGVLDMCDKMLSSLGQSLLLVVSARTFKKFGPEALQAVVLNACAAACLTCHGFVLIYETIALNVAVNSYSNSLVTLLLSMQFAEIKASVFKRFDKEGLFQITISDIIERFQMVILLTIIAIRNLIASTSSFSTLIPNSWSWSSTSSTVVEVLCGPVITVVGSEVLVDWVKHAYIIKFNRVRPQMYDTFLKILCNDHAHNLQKFQVRLGLPVPTLVVLFIVMIRPALEIGLSETSTSMFGTLSIVSMGFVCLFLSKFVLHLVLDKWCQALHSHNGANQFVVNETMYVPGPPSSGQGKIDGRTRAAVYSARKGDHDEDHSKIPPTLIEKRTQHDSKRSLKNVSRYRMVSKRIW
ncbi:LAME_0C05864g1_1 [Lachancea meyersii CBS 8951]|uniref:LAME_0C05864g1_1 n=1 Tax=Lachancea meyersii CBS 8951 TaxID=1266667 RepID=A0A1G4J2C1_9SACH|nr:LAME_0C05864g1_1 [Lachancea meyersii CBS 8951]